MTHPSLLIYFYLYFLPNNYCSMTLIINTSIMLSTQHLAPGLPGVVDKYMLWLILKHETVYKVNAFRGATRG